MEAFDVSGKPIRVGDTVNIPCIITEISPVTSFPGFPSVRMTLKYSYPDGSSTFVVVFGNMVVIDR